MGSGIKHLGMNFETRVLVDVSKLVKAVLCCQQVSIKLFAHWSHCDCSIEIKGGEQAAVVRTRHFKRTSDQKCQDQWW